MTDLKPCPFCGGEDLEIDHAPTYDVYHPDVYEVHCVECGGRGGEDWTKAEAIEAWNTRVKPPCGGNYCPLCGANRRTCKIVFYENPICMDDRYFVSLSCGHEFEWDEIIDGDKPNYCPNCGARVVEVD